MRFSRTTHTKRNVTPVKDQFETIILRYGNPTELDSFWRKQLNGFDPIGRDELDDDDLSQYYRVARDSKIVHNKAKLLLSKIQATIKI